MPEVDPELVQSRLYGKGNTSDYYKQNNGARLKRNAQQARYNKTKKGKDHGSMLTHLIES